MIKESEPNDTSTTANALTTGTAMTGQLSSSTDKDWYKLTVATPGVVTVALDVPTSQSLDYFGLSFYNTSGALQNTYTTGSDRSFTFSAAAAGTYYFLVNAPSFYYSSGSYSLTATVAAGSTAGFESEDNSTLATADRLILGAAITGQLSTTADVDTYSFTVNAAGLVTIFFDSPLSSSLDYFGFGLYDSNGGILGFYRTGQDRKVTAAVSAAGTYYVGVFDSTYYSNASYSVTVSHAAGSTAGFESENNDTRLNANALAIGSSISGQLSSYRDTDVFKLVATGSGIFTLQFDAPTDSAYSEYFNIRITDADGKTISQIQTGSDKTFQGAVSQSGMYFIEVKPANFLHHDGVYSVLATYSAGSSGLELEPNDDRANAINSGVQVKGQLSSARDEDWFFLTTSASSELQIAFDAPTNSNFSDYFQVWIFDEDGNLLASKATGKDSTFTVGASEPGNYFAVVTTAQSYLHDAGQYGLTVTAQASTVPRESESNDTAATADPLALGGGIRGQLATRADIDRFAVTMTSAGTLTVNFDGPTNSTWSNYFDVEVRTHDGMLLATRSTGGDAAFDVKVAQSGTYIIAISTSSSGLYDSGEYRLGVSAVLEDPIPVGAITGTPLGDRLSGTTQDDLIYGLGGNDLIDGDAGTDTVVFRAATANLSINTIGGITAVRGNFAAGEHALSVSRLWNVEKIKTWTDEKPLGAVAVSPVLGTSQADRLTGSAANDLIDGLGGSDFIDGGAGTDTLALFGARDRFNVVTVAGITRIEGGEGTEEYAGHVIRSVAVELLSFNRNETRTLTVNDIPKIFGSIGNDRLNGTSRDEIFDGVGGTDVVDGGAGVDTLVFFGRYQDFVVTLPTTNKPEITVTGKITAGKDYAGQTLRASNIETLAFTDIQLDVKNPPGLVLSPASTLLAEGGGGVALAVSLSVQPTSTVTVSVYGGTQLSANQAKLSFDASSWNTPQTIAVSAVDDSAVEKQHNANLSLAVSSTDPLYATVPAGTVGYTISDNDVASVGSVRGQFWNDADKDGTVDAGELPLAGWTVFVDVNRNGRLDAGEANVQTDASGRYQLDDLSTGTHIIVARPETGWSPTFPSRSGASASVIVNAPGSREGGTGDVVSTTLSSSAAASLYSNLGAATKIGAFHSDPRFSGINGHGVTVVVIDSGIDLDHPAFGGDADKNGIADRIVYSYDFVGSNDSNASDVGGHGTHVAGIIASSDSTYSGIAPAVNIIALRVLGDNGAGTSADLLEAINWVVANAARYNVVAVNLSLGFSTFDKVPTPGFATTQFKALANAGVVVVSASGNDYKQNPVQGVSYPSSDPYSLSVGAVWPAAGQNAFQSGVIDAIAFFSQRDDTESDIFAPGVAITSARNGGGFISQQGTSMAAPQISGMIALAQQLAMKELGRRLSFDEVRYLLKTTGAPIIDGDNENDVVPNTGLTFYRVDMLALAEAILAAKPPISHTVTVTSGTVVDGKNFGFAAVAAVQGLAGDDFIVGASSGEIIRGGAGADRIDAGDGDDQIYGEAGDDVLIGGSGDDTIDGGIGKDVLYGGAGSDTALFQGALRDYRVTAIGDVIVVTDSNTERDGADNIQNVEFLRFADFEINTGIKAVSTSVSTATLDRVIELYVAFFNRIPDANGLSYWLSQAKGGTAISAIADTFYGAGVQYSSLTGFSATMTNADFVNVIYRNVLGRKDGADAEGLAYWTGELSSGRASRGTLVNTILDSAHTFKGSATFGYVADLLDNKITVAKRIAVDWGLNYLSADASISNGMAIAAAVTPTDTSAAIALVGLAPSNINLGGG